MDRVDHGAARRPRLPAQQRRRAADAPLALGWRNCLIAGSVEGGGRTGIIYTLVGTAELNGWDPQTYLRVLLHRIPATISRRIDRYLVCRPERDAEWGVAASWSGIAELSRRTRTASVRSAFGRVLNSARVLRRRD
ncbi:transposase domain-containing protein [Elioraea sp.]|uniref:transposase domain-containing protein n=1 Tax=Elioraea sp. TaxID=2185103 RepID=UPI003F6F1210